LASILRIEPFQEILRIQIRELKKQVRQVALWVDKNTGDAVDGCFFEEVDAQPRFAGAGHAHDDAMRGQIGRVVKHGTIEHFLRGQVVLATEVEAGRPVDVFWYRTRVVALVANGVFRVWCLVDSFWHDRLPIDRRKFVGSHVLKWLDPSYRNTIYSLQFNLVNPPILQGDSHEQYHS
jgi:hypothetical protein